MVSFAYSLFNLVAITLQFDQQAVGRVAETFGRGGEQKEPGRIWRGAVRSDTALKCYATFARSQTFRSPSVLPSSGDIVSEISFARLSQRSFGR